MFEKFTIGARRVFAFANKEATSYNNEYVDTIHLLIGLVLEGSGIGANVLNNIGIDYSNLQKEVEKLESKKQNKDIFNKLLQTPKAKKVVEYAIEEARVFNHSYVGTGHILLGLLRDEKDTPVRVLKKMGNKPERIREEVMKLFGTDIEKL